MTAHSKHTGMFSHFFPIYEFCFQCFDVSLLALQGINISDHFSTIFVVVKGAADLPRGQDASPEQNKVKEIPQNSTQGEIQGEAAAAGAAGSDRSRGGGRTAGAAGEVRVAATGAGRCRAAAEQLTQLER